MATDDDDTSKIDSFSVSSGRQRQFNKLSKFTESTATSQECINKMPGTKHTSNIF